MSYEIYDSAFNPQVEYYQKEMQLNDFQRVFLLYEGVASKDQLVQHKKNASSYEIKTAVDSKRSINIDPGYIGLDQLVLATFKPYYHRLYLGDGVYGDLQFFYSKGVLNPLPWTYPDYQYSSKLELFYEWRNKLKSEINKKRQ